MKPKVIDTTGGSLLDALDEYRIFSVTRFTADRFFFRGGGSWFDNVGYLSRDQVIALADELRALAES